MCEPRGSSVPAIEDESIVIDEYLHVLVGEPPGVLDWGQEVPLLCGYPSKLLKSRDSWETINYTTPTIFVEVKEPQFYGPTPAVYFKGKCPLCENHPDLPLLVLGDDDEGVGLINSMRNSF